LVRVAVIGGGIGGAELVRLASQYPLDLVLIEPKDQIECQALYPEYLAGLAKVDELTAPLKPFCDKVRVEWVRDRAVSLGLRSVVCEKIEVEYDVAVIATGAAQNYFGVKGAHETFSINTFEETVRARKFLEESDPERVMIIGSGLTGIETACVLAGSIESSIYIVEMANRVLPQFSESTSKLVENALSRKGVNILTSTRVQEISADSILFGDGSTLDCDMAIWTAGIKPSKFIEDLKLPKTKGWITVDQYLRALPGVFAIGDAAWIEIDGKLSTKTAMEAERHAAHTARNLHKLAEGSALEKYSVRASTDSQVALISTGCDCAVGVYGKVCMDMPSHLIYSLKSWIDRSFIKRFK
jgi:NADH:ubiquinone reductase (H+-translocating)